MIQIHGKSYVTVAERLEKAKEEITSIETEVLYTEPRVVIKATVTLVSGKIFTGISAANAAKTIEKESPFEVAETSAVGRALAFAGYETTGGIASADEMKKANTEGECEHLNTFKAQFKKEGPNKDKWFEACRDCRKFIKWVPSEVLTDEQMEEIG